MSEGKKQPNELDQDIREHLERETQENIERGMGAEEARYAAMRKFGNVTRVKEETRAVWISVWLEELVQDVRYGLRTMRNSFGFTTVAILTLALGIGANTAIFSLIDAVMLRSLPVEKPSQLMLLKWGARNEPRIHGYMSSGDCSGGLMRRNPGENPGGCSLSESMFRTIEKSQQFSGVAAFANSGFLSMTGNGPASMINGQLVSGDFFRTMGIKPAAGRVLNPNDDTATGASVAVLSYGFWQRNFGGAPDVIGKTIELNNVPFTIAGVAEQRFTGVTPGSDYDVWMPLSVGRRITDQRMWNNREKNVSFWWLTVLGRMKEGTDPQQVQTVVSGVFRNEMLNGAVPLFDATGGLFGPGGPGPGPGGNEARSRVVVGGPGPGPAGPGPSGGPARGIVSGPQMQGPTGGPAGGTVARIANVPRTIQGGAPAGSGPRTGEAQGSGPQALKVAPGQPPAEAATAQRTLSKPDDAPTITLVNAQTGLVGSRQRFANPLYVLMGAVGIILLIACSNVAGLMLARAAARQKEMALRLALGAGRWRVIRQLLTESLMLSVAGGVLGILFASWGARSILSFVSSNQVRPVTFAAGIDLRVLAFTAAVSLLTGILFGVAPALRSTRLDLTPALKEGFGVASAMARGAGRKLNVGNALVVTQVALAVVVLVGAGLLVRTLQNLRNIDVGFDSHNLVLFSINPSLAGYKDSQIDSFYRDLRGRLEQTPGVKSSSYSMLPLLSGSLMITSFHWPGTPQDRESESDMLGVGPNFFSTMHIPFLAGRNFTTSDYEIAANKDAAAAVPEPVIVDQAFVQKYLGNENPIGKRFGESAGTEDETASPGYEIIGVVRDAKYNDLRREIKPMMYHPQTGSGGASFEVRTAGDPQALVNVIRSTVAQVNPNLPLRDVSTESQQIDRLLFQERLVARLSGFFGVLAMVLACIGLYGLLAYEVERRSREIGIRTALGAQEGDVLRLVVKQGLWLTLVGAIVGTGAAIGATRYLKSLLFEVQAYDPITIGIVVAMLVIVALAACLIPARRATHVDPIVALRCE